MSYWVTFTDGTGACVHTGEGMYEKITKAYPDSNAWQERNKMLENEAASYAGLFKPVQSIDALPYGASPSLDAPRFDDFCHSPKTCKGHSSCPRNYACSE